MNHVLKDAAHIDWCTFIFSVIFDAASFYGHHEYDLGIAGMFGGFGSSFYNAYHALIPKSPGFDQRHQLYKLFHNLNHWYVIFLQHHI